MNVKATKYAIKKKLAESTAYGLFVTVSVLLASVEPIIVGFPPHGVAYSLQTFILICSTFLFVYGIFSSVRTIRNNPRLEIDSIKEQLFYSIDLGTYFEFGCLLIGWIFIRIEPGYAAIRCLRIFRYSWYLEIFNNNTKDSEGDPSDSILSFNTMSHLLQRYIKRISIELTNAARGAIIILSIYFFMTYILAVICLNINHTITHAQNNFLSDYLSLRKCFLLMIRLTVFDRKGLDYLLFMSYNGYTNVAILLAIYMIFSSFILINGVIGIFIDAVFPRRRDVVLKKDRLLGEYTNDEHGYRKLYHEILNLKYDIDKIMDTINSPDYRVKSSSERKHRHPKKVSVH